MIELTVNGKKHSVDVEPEMPLLWVLRDVLDVEGPEVRLRHRPVRRLHRARERRAGALVLGARVRRGREEGASPSRASRSAASCTRCRRPGSTTRCRSAATASPGRSWRRWRCSRGTRNPSDEDIDAAMTNICRCGTYARIRAAIHAAAKSPKSAKA